MKNMFKYKNLQKNELRRESSIFLQTLHISAESFYYVNYGLSIITSKVRQIISVMKT